MCCLANGYIYFYAPPRYFGQGTAGYRHQRRPGQQILKPVQAGTCGSYQHGRLLFISYNVVRRHVAKIGKPAAEKAKAP